MTRYAQIQNQGPIGLSVTRLSDGSRALLQRSGIRGLAPCAQAKRTSLRFCASGRRLPHELVPLLQGAAAWQMSGGTRC
jgi:hypothetical protein